jgi:drug/metabolite transporter (DMT)-like permease
MGAAVLLAALSALVWGTADYSGGRAARRTNSLTAAFAAEVVGLPVVLIGLLVVPGTWRLSDVAWAAAAGLSGFAGLTIFYRSLAAGAMSVVAPIAGVTGAALPVAVGLVMDATPAPVTLAGVACAVVAIALVGLGSGRTNGDRRYGLRFVGAAFLAGVLFGLFFVLLDRTAHDSGLWPVAAVRLSSIPAGLLLLRIRRERLVPPRSALPWLIIAGVGDVLANALYLIAVRHGVLTVVAPVAALYPVSTVLLALAIDRERVTAVQIGGLGLAATALVLAAM